LKASQNGSEKRSEQDSTGDKAKFEIRKNPESGKVLKKDRNGLKRVELDRKTNQSHLLTNDSLLKKIHEIKLWMEYCRDSNGFFRLLAIIHG